MPTTLVTEASVVAVAAELTPVLVVGERATPTDVATAVTDVIGTAAVRVVLTQAAAAVPVHTITSLVAMAAPVSLSSGTLLHRTPLEAPQVPVQSTWGPSLYNH